MKNILQYPSIGEWKEITAGQNESQKKDKTVPDVCGHKHTLKPDRLDSLEPTGFKDERTTVWSFPYRGEWATHKGDYRGNWSPYIPRNLLVKYTEPGDTVLDQMCGSGTTLVESKLLSRNCIGIDVNENAVLLSRTRLNFETDLDHDVNDENDPPEIRTFVGDARDLSPIKNESIDLVATHPPYANIINYSTKETEDDISGYAFPKFLGSIEEIANEAFRVLKPDQYCAILIGDTRKKKHYVPVSIGVLQKFLKAGFVLRENVIKVQHNMRGTRERWQGEYDFQLIAHEHLYIFRKPTESENVSKFKWSSDWWQDYH